MRVFIFLPRITVQIIYIFHHAYRNIILCHLWLTSFLNAGKKILPGFMHSVSRMRTKSTAIEPADQKRLQNCIMEKERLQGEKLLLLQFLALPRNRKGNRESSACVAEGGGLKLLFCIYCQYNNFQYASKMNYYALLPNGYTSLLKTPPAIPAQPRSNTSFILSVLSETLKISITNYAAACQQTPLIRKVIPPQGNPPPIEKTAPTADSQGKEVEAKNAQFEIKLEKENISEKVTVTAETNPKSKHSSAHNTTNDQPSLSNHEILPKNRKQEAINILKKDKTRNKKDTGIVSIPLVSLISAASLPSLAFSRQQLKKKRESLLRRQVSSWHQKMTNRRDKRQIRMLAC